MKENIYAIFPIYLAMDMHFEMAAGKMANGKGNVFLFFFPPHFFLATFKCLWLIWQTYQLEFPYQK